VKPPIRPSVKRGQLLINQPGVPEAFQQKVPDDLLGYTICDVVFDTAILGHDHILSGYNMFPHRLRGTMYIKTKDVRRSTK